MTPAELRQWRKRMKWSQTQAAAALDCAVRTYKYYESETRGAVPRIVALAVAELSRHPPNSEIDKVQNLH